MTFTKNEVWECYQFARQMRGKHNRSMIMDRDDWEIFRDDLCNLTEYLTKRTF